MALNASVSITIQWRFTQWRKGVTEIQRMIRRTQGILTEDVDDGAVLDGNVFLLLTLLSCSPSFSLTVPSFSLAVYPIFCSYEAITPTLVSLRLPRPFRSVLE